jgi:hypothetical protein
MSAVKTGIPMRCIGSNLNTIDTFNMLAGSVYTPDEAVGITHRLTNLVLLASGLVWFLGTYVVNTAVADIDITFRILGRADRAVGRT